MEAGRKLDALMATKVMGWKDSGLGYETPEGGRISYTWSPSTDLRTAWQIVEKLRKWSDGHFTLLAFTTNWRAGWDTPDPEDAFDGSFRRFVVAETAPLAICLAALKATEERAKRQAIEK